MSGSQRKPVPPEPPSGPFENIEFLIDGNNGDITVGRVGSIPCVAAAADEDQCLAMLVRRSGESLLQLLRRLDAAIGDAYENANFIDEVNEPLAAKPKHRSKSRR